MVILSFITQARSSSAFDGRRLVRSWDNRQAEQQVEDTLPDAIHVGIYEYPAHRAGSRTARCTSLPLADRKLSAPILSPRPRSDHRRAVEADGPGAASIRCRMQELRYTVKIRKSLNFVGCLCHRHGPKVTSQWSHRRGSKPLGFEPTANLGHRCLLRTVAALRPPRHDPHHAQAFDKAKPLTLNPNFLDRL